jgi:hypothetical protein
MTDWQPIETAPKDGTHILAYWPPIFERTDNAAQVETWFNGSIWENSWDQEFGDMCPSHWMPLPPPPK